MANPNWKKGGGSPNPMGRAKMKNSSRTIKGAVERFCKKNLSVNKLQAMYDALKPAQQFEMLCELLPYCMAKQNSLSIDSRFADLSDADLDKLFNKIVGSFGVADVIETDQAPKETLLLNPSNFSRYGQE